VTVPALRTEKGDCYLHIIDRARRRLVTVLELLSPSNKNPGPDRAAALAKRQEYQMGGVNLVEIDLLRQGARFPLGDPQPAVGDYCAFAWRVQDLPKAWVWSWSVRAPLPDIAVPLEPEDGWVTLSLQTCFSRAYDEAGYVREIDYARPPDPPLDEPDATWARELLANRPPPVVR
jgi:hypothetical protein